MPDLSSLSAYDYPLDPDLIAQQPADKRSNSRLLVCSSINSPIIDSRFAQLTEFLQEGDLLILNTSKVWRARLTGRKLTADGEEGQGALIELLLTSIAADGCVEFLAKPAKRLKIGTAVLIGENRIEITGKSAETLSGRFKDKNGKEADRCSILHIIEQHGEVPLPPYIKKKGAEISRYQTIYAKEPGSSAAPTAGLHFDTALFQALKQKGILTAELSLHVGAGTFLPVREEDTAKHKMHSEPYTMPLQTAEALNRALKEGRRIVAVGTTALRALEDNLTKFSEYRAGEQTTDIFIRPPQSVKSADLLITNFHLPKSTLLMLVSAFGGYEFIQTIYRHALNTRCRFFSFGDAMLLANTSKQTPLADSRC